MDPSTIRFLPPVVDFTPELRWVLLRAFGPQDRQLSWLVDPAESLRLAEALQLGSRIASRNTIESLRSELDFRSADRLREIHQLTTALALLQEQLARRVAELAAESGLPLVFLKGMALQLRGIVPVGSRRASDVDILVPRRGAADFHQRLQGEGFRALELPPGEYHLPPLRYGSGIILEIHPALRSVEPDGGGGSPDAERLIDAGLCLPVQDWPGACHVPAKEMNLTMLLVHGIAQHGYTPAAYPMIRLAADLIDLDFDDTTADPFLKGPGKWIAHAVSCDEITALARLCSGLRIADGRLYRSEADYDGALLMLRHMVAGALDREYRQSLRLKSFLGEARGKSIRRLLRETLVLTPGQMELSFGCHGGRLTRPLLLLWRPFQLLGRLALHTWRYLVSRMHRN